MNVYATPYFREKRLPRAEATENQNDELITFCNIRVLALNSNIAIWVKNLHETGKSGNFSIAEAFTAPEKEDTTMLGIRQRAR